MLNKITSSLEIGTLLSKGLIRHLEIVGIKDRIENLEEGFG